MGKHPLWSIEFIGKEIKDWTEDRSNKDRFYEEPLCELNEYIKGIKKNPGILSTRIGYLGEWYLSKHIVDSLFDSTNVNDYLYKSCLYSQWMIRISDAFFNLETKRPKKDFNEFGLILSHLLAAGSYSEAKTAGYIILNGLQKGLFLGIGSTRLSPFILGLFCQWQHIDFLLEEYKNFMPIDEYRGVLEVWDSQDLKLVQSKLFDACDLHISRSKWGTNKEFFEFSQDEFMIYPVEILAVLRLREFLGLENPILNHKLMNSPLGKLIKLKNLQPDPLITEVISKLKKELPGLK
jgi:hypothetical protein